MPSRQSPAIAASPPPPLPVVFAALFLLLSATTILCLWPRRRWRSSNKTAPGSPSTPSAPPQPRRYSYDHLRRATSSFSLSNKLGQGGFGPVFRGCLSPGYHVAIKVMDSASLQGETEFRNELALASTVMKTGKSPHVVCAIGFCSDDEPDEKKSKRNRNTKKKKKKKREKKKGKFKNWLDHMEAVDGDSDGYATGGGGDSDDLEEGMGKTKALLLVYELMPNGSLQDALLIRRRPEMMEWPIRFSVALDVARSLCFLHSECDPPIVHGDVKPSNVLLDGSFSAKIADFGLSRKVDPTAKVGGKNTSPNLGAEETAKDFVSSTEASPIPQETTEDGSGDSSHGELRRNRSRSVRVVLEWMESEIKDDRKEKPRPQLRDLWREESCEDKEDEKGRKGSQRDRRAEWRRKESWSRGSRRDGGMSSTTSMRGTMSYAAPECGAEEVALSDRADVYSFGVLLLVIVSGRRPLQVTAAPGAEHANLLKWARMLARRGKVVELVDGGVRDVKKGEAERCVQVALLCVQRVAEKRPSMKDVVGMLTGALELPQLPPELQPSARGGRRPPPLRDPAEP